MESKKKTNNNNKKTPPKTSKQNTTKQAYRADWWFPKPRGGMGDMGEGDQKVQTSKHKIYKSWGG